MQSFITLGQPLLGEKYVEQKTVGKNNNHKNSGHFVPLQCLRAAHTLHTDQLFVFMWLMCTMTCVLAHRTVSRIQCIYTHTGLPSKRKAGES